MRPALLTAANTARDEGPFCTDDGAWRRRRGAERQQQRVSGWGLPVTGTRT
jgi:hypothetical protein